MKVLYNEAKAKERHLHSTYLHWALGANIDLKKPLVCVGRGRNFGYDQYVVLRPSGGKSDVRSELFDVVFEEAVDLERFM